MVRILELSKRYTRHLWPRLPWPGYFTILCIIVSFNLHPALAQPGSAKIEGTVVTLDATRQATPVSNASVTITSAPGSHQIGSVPIEPRTITAGLDGTFTFTDLLGGCFVITAESEGLTSSRGETCLLNEGAYVSLTLEMKVATLADSVNVTASAEQLDSTESTSSGSIAGSTMQNLPSVTEQFDSFLPILPGVVRGPDGRINMKGARAAQGGALVNSANATDPYTGNSAISIPVDAVDSVKVIANPYDAEYGKLAGAVSTVETRMTDLNRPHFILQNLTPGMKVRDGAIMGIEKFIPRMTFSVPLLKNRLAITQSTEYRFVRTQIRQAGLPKLARDTGSESFDSLTRADLQISSQHTASASLSIYPRKLNYFGLDTFTPQDSTPDIRQRGYMLMFHDQYAFNSGSLLSSRISYKTFDSDVRQNILGNYQRAIDTTFGGFFNQQNRDTDRVEYSETFSLHPWNILGQQHLIKTGVDLVRESYDGRQTFLPIELLGIQNRLTQRITFGDPTNPSIDQNQYSAFVQDKWSISPWLTLDLGLRFDRNNIAKQEHLAPRLGFSLLLDRSGKTVLRGGVGLFYDRINLNVASFLDMPERTETRFSPGGVALSQVAYQHRFAGALQDPRSTGWSFQIDRQVSARLLLRSAYQQRITSRNFVINPEQGPQNAFLTLANEGRDRYREFEVTGRYQINDRGVLTASYVRSSSVGNVNDFNSIFSNAPLATIRPDERSRLAFDVPHRFITWADFQTKWKLTISPLVDIRSGFPFSVVDEMRDFVGPRNRAGRYPRFISTDLQVLRTVRLPGTRKKVRAGVRVFNLFNHFNPVDFQGNLASSSFRTFTNSPGRIITGKLIFGGG